MQVREKVLVLDFGAQYSQLIARRVRECGVYAEVVPGNTAAAEIQADKPDGLILSGGPDSVYKPGALRPDDDIYELGIPILAICYGQQLLAVHFGGEDVVSRAPKREYGRTELIIEEAGQLFHQLPQRLLVWMSHGDRINEVPPGFNMLAKSDAAPVAAMARPEDEIYAVQFHPEVQHTEHGSDILENWLFRICQMQGSWSVQSFVEDAVDDIRSQIGEGRALCGLSGGVDSAVAATLVNQAVGGRLVCVFVDHGLLRAGEFESVSKLFSEEMGVNLVTVDARSRFLQKLSGVQDPEQKRKIIGEEFIAVFEEEAEKLGDIDYLVQGTIYPDVVESGTQTASVIKSHHNVGGLPEHMNLDLVEPLRYLFKDEVREVGTQLGLPEEVVWRHPFPGPGLAVRVLGKITADKLKIIRQADHIFIEELRENELYREVWQAFAVIPDVKSVGVMGDRRTYGQTVVLRAVTSTDAMTADWARIPFDVLDETARRIVNEVEGVNRVAYDITAKPPGTIEWE